MRARVLFTGAAACAALVLTSPEETGGYSLLGGSLSLSQRDVRIFNNFNDLTANDYTTEHPEWPGYTGAEQAIWRAVMEWGSELHGSGGGDPTQIDGVGNGGANFDPSWQGNATGIGTSNSNIHSGLSGGSGGVLAYCETPISDGWRIRYYESWIWDDDATWPTGTDLQGIGVHEYGHALGLGHSSFGQATMFATASGSGIGQRSISSDDAEGVQAIYGVKAVDKPRITNVIQNGGSSITIQGTNFSNSNNELWFTKTGTGGNGTPIKMGGVSSSNGGTEITINVPGTAGPGDVMVKVPGSSHSDLSNGWPWSYEEEVLVPCFDYVINEVVPAQIGSVVPGNDQTVELRGCGFTGVTSILVDGEPLPTFPLTFTTIHDQRIQFQMPNVTTLGMVDIEINGVNGTTTAQIEVVPAPIPALELGEGNVPETINSFAPSTLTMGGQPGNAMFLWGSIVAEPSDVPGLFSLDIGDGLTNIVLIGAYILDGSGQASISLPLSGLPFGLLLYFQGIEYDTVSMTLPAPETNVSTGFWVF